MAYQYAGLNAPIPPGASFGYHPGGWGKPPVDEYGRPLYGDAFGVHQQDGPNYENEKKRKRKMQEKEGVEDKAEMHEHELAKTQLSKHTLPSNSVGNDQKES